MASPTTNEKHSSCSTYSTKQRDQQVCWVSVFNYCIVALTKAQLITLSEIKYTYTRSSTRYRAVACDVMVGVFWRTTQKAMDKNNGEPVQLCCRILCMLQYGEEHTRHSLQNFFAVNAKSCGQ